MITLKGIRTTSDIRTTIAVLLCAAAGCTFVLDKEKAQCVVDADCARLFGGHPFCGAGVCVVSGLGPEGCVVDPPKTQSDYLNACSTSKCVPFDNCERIGLCPGVSLPSTQDPLTDTSPALTNPVPKPTNLCTDGAPGSTASPNMIYLYGSADFGPLLHAAQPSLSALDIPYRAVFQGASSCAGATSVFDPAMRTGTMKDPIVDTNGGWAFYFDNNGQQVNCLLNPAGTTINIGISDLYGPTCNPNFVPGSTVAEYLGPVVPFVLSVRATSSQESISTEALHLVFGLGGKAPPGSSMKDAAPWTDWRSYFIRNSGGASTVLTGLLSEVPRTKFWGVDRRSTENLRDSLLVSQNIDASIGILSIDFNDKYRGNLKALYLQSKGQKCGYQPDSSPTTYDKVNVRDGHYPLWGYVHFYTPLDQGGTTAAANAMVLLFNVQKLEKRLLDDVIAASLTPQCAMKVARTSEVGDYAPRTGFQCGCYFDFKTKGKTSCTPCNISEDCPTDSPACNYGYCEPNK